MKAWVSAGQLAVLSITGLPATERAVQLRAKREGWPSQARTGRGGGREYCVQSLLKRLPEQSSAALLRALIDTTETPPTVPAEQTPGREVTQTPPPMPTADWQRRCAEARAAILLEIDRVAVVAGVNRAIEQVVTLAASGELRPDLQELVPLANARGGKTGNRTLSRRSIYRWRGEAEKGFAALVPYSQPMTPPPAWAAALLRLYNTPTKRSLAALMDDLPDALPAGVACPSYDQARRFLGRVSVVDRERGRHGPNGLLKYKAFKRRSTEGLQPLDVVTADGHAFKADVAHPVHGRPFRPELCTVQDVATRYVFGWSAGLAESTTVVMDAIRNAVETLGLFALFYTDNGSGFVNDAMTADVTGFLSRLHASPTNSLPGRAQARGKIERLQASLWKRAARKLPSYNGRDMDNETRHKVVKLVKRDIKAFGASRFLMDWQQFLDFAATEINAYNNRPHRSLKKIRDGETGKLRHLSPAEALAEQRAGGWAPTMLSVAEAADLWRPYEIRTTARGEVRLPWGIYFAQELVPFGGEKVRVGYDIHDGSRAWVRTLEDGRLICVAVKDGNVIPEQPASKIEHARHHRAKGRLKILQDHAEEVRAEMGPPLIEHSVEQPFNAALEARQRELEAEWLQPVSEQSEQIHHIDTRRTRFMRSLEIQRRQAAGEEVSAEEERWHRVYSGQPEYRAAMNIYEDFGADALEA